VPVKDRYRDNSGGKRKIACWSKFKKNAASGSALRRVERFVERILVSRQKSEFRWLFGWGVWGIAVAVEAFACGFSDRVAQHVTQLGAISLALLAQFLQSLGIGDQRFDGICGRWLAACGQQRGKRHGWNGFHGVTSLCMMGLSVYASTKPALLMNRPNCSEGTEFDRNK
jgi:hypothetical protein